MPGTRPAAHGYSESGGERDDVQGGTGVALQRARQCDPAILGRHPVGDGGVQPVGDPEGGALEMGGGRVQVGGDGAVGADEVIGEHGGTVGH